MIRGPNLTPQQMLRNRKRLFWGFAACTALLIGLAEIKPLPPEPPPHEMTLEESCDEMAKKFGLPGGPSYEAMQACIGALDAERELKTQSKAFLKFGQGRVP
jgi:hypothetical protein